MANGNETVAAPTPDAFRVAFPEFANATRYSDDLIEFEGSNALEIAPVSNLAVLWLTAHLLTLHSERGSADAVVEPDGGASEIRMEEAGDRRVEYTGPGAGGDSDDDFFRTSPYGRRFIAIRNNARLQAKSDIYIGNGV